MLDGNIDKNPAQISKEESVNENEKNGLTKKQKGLMALIAVGLTVAAGLGVSANANKSKAESSRTPLKNEQVANNQKPAETDSVETSSAESPELDTDKYGQQMEKYYEMSIDEFESLPRDERLAYATYLIDQTVTRGNYDRMYGPNTARANYAIEYTTPSLKNTAQNILDNSNFVRQIAAMQFIEGGASADHTAQPFDKGDGQKLLSAVYYRVGDGNTSNAYKEFKATLEGLEKPSGIKIISSALDGDKLLTGHDRDGDKVKYKNLTIEGEDTYYARYIYCEFVSYDNKKQSIWLLDVAEESMNALKSTPIN